MRFRVITPADQKTRPSTLFDLPIAIGFLLLVCCGASASWLFSEQRQSDSWVRHTLVVEYQLSQLQIYGLKVGIDVRTSILAGKDGPEIDLAANKKRFSAHIAELKQLTADNPSQQKRLITLEQLSDARYAVVRKALLAGRAGKLAEASRLIASPESRAESQRVQRQMGDIRAEELRLLELRTVKSRELEGWAYIALGASVLMALFLAILVFPERRARISDLWRIKRELEEDVELRQAAEARLAHLVENTTDAIIRVGLDGMCLYASPAVREVQGYDPDVLVGQNVFQKLHPEDEAELLDRFELMRRGELDQVRASYRAADPRAEGRWIWLEANCRLIRAPSGAPLEILASVRDISEIKQLEVDLQLARSKAETAAQAKASFLANMSHEIRTPMNGVLGFTELVLADSLSGEQRKRVELIDSSGRAMMRLLNDILDFSKIEAGQMRISHEPFDLRHALQACVTLIKPAAERKGLRIDLEIETSLPKAILGDGLRLRQIILNLLGNAVKFTDDGSIALRVSSGPAPSGSLCIDVADTGIGIDQDRQAAIFEEFVQAEDTTASRFGGTGLGLSITMQLVKLMGGTLELESVAGRGSTFRIILPLEPAAAGAALMPTIETAPAPDRSHHRRILLAEDHDVNQELFLGMLAKLGWRADLAVDGAEAVRMIENASQGNDPYGLVLMDVQMPNMDGLEATRRIRAAEIGPDRLPILMLTANAYASDVAKCFTAGAQAHLAKPIQMAELDRALCKWIRSAPVRSSRSRLSPKLIERYERSKIETLEAVDAMVRRGRFANKELESVSELLHKLAGVAAMFGEAELGKRARDLEVGLTEWIGEDRKTMIVAAAVAVKNAA